MPVSLGAKMSYCFFWSTPLSIAHACTRRGTDTGAALFVLPIQRRHFPTPRATAAARAAPSTSTARVGPVVYGLLLTFRGNGYG